MEPELSGTADETSFTQNGEGWDDATNHEEITCDHSVHQYMDSYADEFNTSQGCVCETSDGQDTVISVEQESANAFESRVETPTDVISNEDMMAEMCFSPSYICKDLSSVFNHKDSTPVSNREHLRLDSTEETFRFHNCDVSPDLSDEEIPSAVNEAELGYHDLNQDVRLAFQHQQVALHLS